MGYGGVKMRGGENNGWEEEQRLKNEEKGRTSKETATDRDATEEAPKEAKGGGEGTKKTAARRLEGEGGRRRTHLGNQERRPDDCQLGEWHIQERPEAQLQDLERPEEVVAVVGTRVDPFERPDRGLRQTHRERTHQGGGYVGKQRGQKAGRPRGSGR